MVCSAHSALIAVLGRPWRHTGPFGPRTARTRDAHEVPSPSPASEHSRCPLVVHCSMRPCGASARRVHVRPRQDLSHMIQPCERGGVPTTVHPIKPEPLPAGNEFTLNLCTPMEPLLVWAYTLVNDTRPSPHLDTPRIADARGRRPCCRHLLLCRECGRGPRPSPPVCSSFATLAFFAACLS
jgi:hypothetical protein